MNQELCNKCKPPDIVTVFRVRRFQWLGHVRVESEGTVHMLLGGKRGGGSTRQAVYEYV